MEGEGLTAGLADSPKVLTQWGQVTKVVEGTGTAIAAHQLSVLGADEAEVIVVLVRLHTGWGWGKEKEFRK